ncbi:uncharacterized protein LOC134540952 [Bacillus rossius redtenbacheri]|uniref:uncharacterized protein LOC134540952 n=1 Tax=Bacillus rossius redtenbacheri TaxID=93214 RepID=UPI002FDE899F
MTYASPIYLGESLPEEGTPPNPARKPTQEEAEDPDRTPARRCPEPPHAGTLADTAPPIDLEYREEPRTQSHRHQRPPRHLEDYVLVNPQQETAGTPTDDLSRGLGMGDTEESRSTGGLNASTFTDTAPLVDLEYEDEPGARPHRHRQPPRYPEDHSLAKHNQTPTQHHLGPPHSTPFADAASPGHPESEDETRTWPHRRRHPPRYLEDYVLNTPPGETADTSASCLPNDQGTEQEEPQPTVELVDEDPSPEGAPLRCHPCDDDPGTITITELPYSPGNPEMDSDPGTIPLVTEPEEEYAENYETPRNSPPGIPERERSGTVHHAPCRRPLPSCLRSRPGGVRRAALPCAVPPPPAQLPPQSTGQRAPRHPSMRRVAAPSPAASGVDWAACAALPFQALCRRPRPSCLRSRPGGVRHATPPPSVTTPQLGEQSGPYQPQSGLGVPTRGGTNSSAKSGFSEGGRLTSSGRRPSSSPTCDRPYLVPLTKRASSHPVGVKQIHNTRHAPEALKQKLGGHLTEFAEPSRYSTATHDKAH